MKLSDLLCGIGVVGLVAAIGLAVIKGCYNAPGDSQPQIQREAEPTIRQAGFEAYVPRDANSNYDSNSR